MLMPRLTVLLLVNGFVFVQANFILPKAVVGENSTEELVAKWQKLDKSFVDIFSMIAEMVIPRIIKASGEFEISGECQASVFRWLSGLKQQTPWALQMLDASGKVSSGLLGGTITDFGNFDDCIKIEVVNNWGDAIDFTGQYCNLEFRPPLPNKPQNFRYTDRLPQLGNFTPKNEYVNLISSFPQLFYFVFIRTGICLPSTCPKEDILNVAAHLGNMMGLYTDVSRCETKEEIKITTEQWIVIGVIAFLVLLCLIGTAVEKFSHDEEQKSLALQLALTFSVPGNVKRLLNTDRPSSDVVPVLDGMRFMSISWVVLGHNYLFINWQALRHFRHARDFVAEFIFQPVMSGFVAVDSFFFMSGLLVSYLTMKHVLKDGPSFFNIPLFIVKRIWRLLPSTMLMVAVTLLLPLIGSGPMWHETQDITVEMCRKNWWTNFLFINNYLYPPEQCQSTTWFTACELQLYLVGLFFLALVIRKVVAGFALLVFLMIFAIVSTAAVTYWYNLLPAILFISPDPEGIINFWHYTHFKPHVHVGGYAIGLGLGYILALKKFPKFNRVQKLAGWILAFVLATLVTYGTYEWNRDRPPTRVESVLFGAFHRNLWVVAIAWVTYACTAGFGGVINSILSWKGFIPLSRLTFLVYLYHAMIIWYYMASLRGAMDTSHMVFVWMFLGSLCVSFAVAFVMHILCEAPFAQLERVILGRRSKSFSNKESYDVEQTTTNGKQRQGPNGVVVYKM